MHDVSCIKSILGHKGKKKEVATSKEWGWLTFPSTIMDMTSCRDCAMPSSSVSISYLFFSYLSYLSSSWMTRWAATTPSAGATFSAAADRYNIIFFLEKKTWQKRNGECKTSYLERFVPHGYDRLCTEAMTSFKFSPVIHDELMRKKS